MTKNTSLNSIAFSIALVMICSSLGCEQQRYSPSAWAPATGGNGTLPGVGQLGDGSTSSLPTRTGTLPGRAGTLPGRSGNGTLPSRNLSSLPWRAGSQTLPNRAGTLPSRPRIVVTGPKPKRALPSLAGKPVWDVREKREMPRAPGKPGLYMGEDEDIVGFSANNFRRDSGSTLPSRGATTLPARARNSNWSTLPGRK